MKSIHFLLFGFLSSLIINQINFNVHNKNHQPDLLKIITSWNKKTLCSKKNLYNKKEFILYVLIIYVVCMRGFFCKTKCDDDNNDNRIFFFIKEGSIYLNLYNKKLHIHHWILFSIVYLFSMIAWYNIHPSFVNTKKLLIFICGISMQTILDGLLFEDRFDVLLG